MKRYSYTYCKLIILMLMLSQLASCTVAWNQENDGGNTPGPPIYPQPYSEPSFSSDGRKMLVVRKKVTTVTKDGFYTIDPDSSGIWLAGADGSNMKLLLRGQNFGSLSFSPDMQWILFEAGAQIYKARFAADSIDADSIIQLTKQGRNFFPDWSPDGEWIAFDSNLDSPNGLNFVWKMKADGSAKIRIAYAPDEGETRMPSWSPDGQKIVHIRFLVGVFSSEIYSMGSVRENPIRLTNNEATDRYPRYSPDGTQIAFQSDGQVYVMNADGSDPKQLHPNGGMPDWSPDGHIVYVNFDPRVFSRDNGTIWIMDADGSNKKQLTRNYGLILEQ